MAKVKTAAVHAGERVEGSRAIPLAPPLFTSSVSYFDAAGALDAALVKAFAREKGAVEQVRLCRPAPSLGDVTTLVMHPATASARRMTPEERAAAGIRENLIRVSVGLEDPDDVADDLLQAAAAALG